MLWYVIVIEAIVFAVLFTTILFVSFHGTESFGHALVLILGLVLLKEMNKSENDQTT